MVSQMKNFHLCKEDYQEVKTSLSMRQVAELYGFHVNERGKCLCPFHNDAHPSMKIYANDKGYYCFSCGSGGDAIKFVAELYSLRNEEACLKLIEDFSLPIQTEALSYREKREREKRIGQRKELDYFVKCAYVTLAAYRQLLCEAARNPEDEHFIEALQELSIVDYRLECLKKCPERYYADKKAVRRIGAIRKRVIGWHGCNGTGAAISR